MKLGVLDQSPVVSGSNPVEAMQNTIRLAKATELLGYSRYWLSEHHDTAGLAGSSPEVLVSAVAAHTSRMRIGTGGVMLPHYSPYKVAENFRVLEALYPGRIDMGIGRAPGGMPLASKALRYGRPVDYEGRFIEALVDLAGFLGDNLDPAHPYASLQATPAVQTVPQGWLLGSSGYSAGAAAMLGSAFSFAHFINGSGGQAYVRQYKQNFRSGPFGAEPRANVCVTVMCADSDKEAERLAASIDLRLLYIGKSDFRQPFPSPQEAAVYPYTDWDRQRIKENRSRMIVGGPETVKNKLAAFAESYGVDELIILTMAHDFQTRLHSYELLAEMFL